MKHPARLLGLLASCLLSTSVLANAMRYFPLWGVTEAQLGETTGLFAATGIALDTQGNLLVVGNGPAWTNHGAVAKISPTGSVIWYQSITRPGALGILINAVACDPSDNVYVAGGFAVSGGTEVIVEKFNSAGSLLWTYTTSGGTGGLAGGAGGRAIAVDASSVYVGGAWGSPSPWYWLAKLSAAGGVTMTRTATALYAGTACPLIVSQIALDGSSNVFVTSADSSGPPGNSIGIEKYSSALVSQWSRTSTLVATDCGGRQVGGGVGGGAVQARVAADGTLWVLTNASSLFQLASATGLITKGTRVETTTNVSFNDFAFWPSGFALFSSSGLVAGMTSWGYTGGGSCLGQENGWVASDFSRATSSFNSSFYPVKVLAGSNGDAYVAGSGGAVVVALRDMLAQNPVKAGTLEIRNNIIALESAGQKEGGYSGVAYIFVRAGSGSTDKGVKVGVYGPSGKFLGSLSGITIGADGTGSLAFDGVVEGKRLSTGMYYIVVTGAGIKDRKPIMILGRKDQ